MAFEFGIEVLLNGPANTEIGNQRPGLRHLEYPAQALRLEDRNPAKPQSLGTRRKPQGLDGCNDRILPRLEHGLPTEPAPSLACRIGGDGQMPRSIFNPLRIHPA